MIIQKIKDLVGKLNTPKGANQHLNSGLSAPNDYQKQEQEYKQAVEVPNIVTKDRLSAPEISFLLRQEQTKVIELKEELTEQSRKAAAKIEHITELLRVEKEEKDKLIKDTDKLKADHRHQVIEALHEGLYYSSDEEHAKIIDSLVRSQMPIEDVKKHCSQVRSFQSGSVSQKGTKLPQRSTYIE